MKLGKNLVREIDVIVRNNIFHSDIIILKLAKFKGFEEMRSFICSYVGSILDNVTNQVIKKIFNK